MEYQPNQELEFSEKQKKELTEILREIASYEETIANLSKRTGMKRNDLWEKISEIHPNAEDYELTAGLTYGKLVVTIGQRKDMNPERSVATDADSSTQPDKQKD